MNTKQLDKEERRHFWQQLVNQYRASSLNLCAFSRRHGVHHDTLRYWHKKFAITKLPNNAPKALPVHQRFVTVPLQVAERSPRIVLPNGVAIELNASLHSESVVGLVKTLCGIGVYPQKGCHEKP